jgi:hypothetical protein
MTGAIEFGATVIMKRSPTANTSSAMDAEPDGNHRSGFWKVHADKAGGPEACDGDQPGVGSKPIAL